MIKKTIKRLSSLFSRKPDNQQNIEQKSPDTLSSEKPPDKQKKEPRKTSAVPAEKKTGDNRGGNKPKRRRKKKTKWDVSRFNVQPAEGKTRFHDLDIPTGIMHAVADLRFKYCTPVQAETLPRALKGRDATGQAQTGTGKSAAFLITILTRLFRNPIKGKRMPGSPRALILAPTRELALQIEKDAIALGKYTRSRTLAVFGGMGYEKQKKVLKNKIVDIIAATPGRLLDFQRQEFVNLSKVEILVIDEADRMLDMGFIPDIRNIVYSTPKKEKRQTLFFSATITPDVENLAKQWTRKDAFSVAIEPETIAADSVNQIVYIVTSKEKFSLLYNLILEHERVLVFSNRRVQARDLMEKLKDHGVSCDLISGEVAQNKRLKVLEKFKTGKIRVLAATDVAARGIHVEDISLVVNYNLSQDPEDYVHRIGRTGRAGSTGTSVSFADEYDSYYIADIEEFLKDKIHCEHPDEALLKPPPKPVKSGRWKKQGQQKKTYSHGKNKKNYSKKSGKYQSRARHQRGRNSGKKKTGQTDVPGSKK